MSSFGLPFPFNREGPQGQDASEDVLRWTQGGEHSRTTKHDAKPAGSNSDYQRTVGRWQWALGSKKANTREQLAKIRHQQEEVSKAISAEHKASKVINRRFTQMDTERNPFKNITAEAKSLSAWRKAHCAFRTEFRVLSEDERSTHCVLLLTGYCLAKFRGPLSRGQ